MRKCILILLTLLLPSLILAKSITLYEKPTTTAKIVASVQVGTPLIKIYSPKGSTWVKVANKNNGHVGWVKKSDVEKNAKSQAITFHRHFEKPVKDNSQNINLKATNLHKVKNHDILV